jgi:non-specific serine/threonine protein kinase
MKALAADGGFPAALLVYRELRLYLHRELNAEPDPATKALYERLRADERSCAARGWESEAVVEVLGGRNTASRSKFSAPAPQPISRLPKPLTTLVGRTNEVGELTRDLEAARLVSLTGTGGVGKTRLAIQVAEAETPRYPDGAWFVDLASLSETALVPARVAAALGMREPAGRAVAVALAEFLRDRHLLLLLDNCEHLLTGCARLAAELLEGCPRLHILATSRQPLGLPGELVRRVPSLSLPGRRLPGSEGNEELATLLEYEAICLFVERARQAEPAFQATPGNAMAIVRVCQRLDGIPLALELAAARVRALTVEQIAARLDDRFRLLTSGSPAAPPRQQTLRAALDWSYTLLEEDERALLCRLSVFVGGWSLESAEEICGDDGFLDGDSQFGIPQPAIYRGDVLDLLAALVNKSLVVYEACQGEARYRMLESVQQYGREKLQEIGAGETWRARHMDYFLAFAERAEAGLSGAEQGAWLERLGAARSDLHRALELALERDPEAALRLVGALGRFWDLRSEFAAGRAAL